VTLSENYKTTLAQLRDQDAKKRKDAARIVAGADQNVP
jgi:hypothetical protein